MSASRFNNKTVVVTGGSKGVGLGLVRKFLAANANVYASTRHPDGASELLQLQQSARDRLKIATLDTARPDTISGFPTELRSLGVQHVDVLINNAGMYGRRLGLLELEASDFVTTFQTNTIGPFLTVQSLMAAGLLGRSPEEKQQQGPYSTLIANMSSIVASHGDQTVSSKMGGGYAYRASKAALNIINKSLCFDLAPHGIASVLLHPGYVKTELTGGLGDIEVEESAAGLFAVLDSDRELNNKFYSFNGSEIPW